MKVIKPSTKQALLESAFELLNQNPKASLADIAALAGVGRATLHRHFSGRDDLIEAMTLQAIDETEQAADEASKNSTSYSMALEQIFKAMIPLGNRYWFLAQQPPSNHKEITRQLKQQNKVLNQVVSKAKTESLFDTKIPNNWIIQTYDHLIHAAWAMIKAGHATPTQASELAWTTLVHGLKRLNEQ